ncbi:unknown [Clostridium sp. CAG:306]|nr:unknown [Clostridium sp. CAG:306]
MYVGLNVKLTAAPLPPAWARVPPLSLLPPPPPPPPPTRTMSYWLFAKKSILLLWPGYKASITRLLYPAPPPPPPPTALIIKFLALGGGVNSQWSALTTGVGASCEYDECIPSSSISQVHWPCGMFSRLLFFFVITGIVAIVIKLTTKRAIKASAREKPLQAECFGETFFILFKSFNSTFLCFYT